MSEAPPAAASLRDPAWIANALGSALEASPVDALLDRVCALVAKDSPWARTAFVVPQATGMVSGIAGIPPAEVEAFRARLAAYGTKERREMRRRVLDRHRLAPDLDVVFVPREARGPDLPALVLPGPGGEGPEGIRWEEGDELVLLPHARDGTPLGLLSLGAPRNGRRPGPQDLDDLRVLLRLAVGVGHAARGRREAFEQGRREAERVLGFVESLAGVRDVGVLLDRISEVCARTAGYRVGVLTAHLDDGPHVGAYGLGDEERARFRASSSSSPPERSAAKRRRILEMAFPGTGISYVPKSADLSRSRAFRAGRASEHGSWDPEDRLFLILKTMGGHDIGVLSLDEPLDGNAPHEDALGALRIAERLLDLGGALVETHLLQARMEQAQRLEALGSLAAGIAHDFNNLIGAILGYTSLLRMRLSEGSEAAALAANVEHACERAAELTRRLRALTRAPLARRADVDVRRLLEDCGRVVRETFDRRIALEVEAPDDLPPVVGDSAQVYQALMNLCIAARDAMPEGGRIRLLAAVDPAPAGAAAGTPARWVRVDVEDDGPPIPEETRGRIFEPFFTFRRREGEAKGKGAGLGLFLTYSIVRSHGGTVDLADRSGGGTRFRVLLPARDREGADASSPVPGGGSSPARVLVVEDEAMMRDLLRRSLVALGHQVALAEDGNRAVELLRARPAEFDLVVLDLVLPGRSGAEVFREIRALRPDLPVILSSGNVEEGMLDAELARHAAAALPKPWRVPDLQAVVRRVLAGRQGTGTD